ncbi:hypothetical protein QEG73_20050 [Chitinophagaceae bacterium 26-R-25]|nr:hypothetical protein [Chitinophagaceae bacterium 26-R-25]
MNRTNILLTFDYELFLGARSGTAQKCIIEPTNKLIDILKKNGAKGIFFVDTLYILRLKEVAARHPKAANDFEEIIAQLRVALKNGSYIFPHLHPHWLDAEYMPEANEWKLDNKRYYRFNALDKCQQQDTFDQSVKLIEWIASAVTSDYKIDGYRAGGWSIQPFADFMPLFLKHGIYHEFSVRKETYFNSDAQYFDFRNAPQPDIYHFADDILKEQKSGVFKEYCISSVKISKYVSWCSSKANSLRHVLGIKGYGDGIGVKSLNVETSSQHDAHGNFELMASIEEFNIVTYFEYKKAAKNTDYMHFLSHPKMITPLQMHLFDRFLRTLKSKNIETDFRKFTAVKAEPHQVPVAL